jgi:hypothetical protein
MAARHCGDEGNDSTTATTAARHRSDEGDNPTKATTASRHRGDEGDDPTTRDVRNVTATAAVLERQLRDSVGATVTQAT